MAINGRGCATRLVAPVWRLRQHVGVMMLAALVSGCMVPRHMNVTQGVDPRFSDTDVRFRTTYYFRTFDYCWNRDAAASGGVSGPAMSYRNIIPGTDTVYRFRMTGKAPGRTTRVKFESGTLRAEVIDQFGADVRYSSEADGFYVRSADEMKAEVTDVRRKRQEATAKSELLAAYTQLGSMLAALGPEPSAGTDGNSALRAKLVETMNKLIEARFAPAGAAAPSEIAGAIAREVAPLKADIANMAGTSQSMRDELVAKLSALPSVASSETSLTVGPCSIGTTMRTGFQLIGPEGIKTFDQGSRLIMAMYSSADPLIATLEQYAQRVLKPRVNPAEALLPLVRENLRTVEAQRAIDLAVDPALSGQPAIDKIFEATAAAFTPPAADATPASAAGAFAPALPQQPAQAPPTSPGVQP